MQRAEAPRRDPGAAAQGAVQGLTPPSGRTEAQGETPPPPKARPRRRDGQAWPWVGAWLLSAIWAFAILGMRLAGVTTPAAGGLAQLGLAFLLLCPFAMFFAIALVIRNALALRDEALRLNLATRRLMEPDRTAIREVSRIALAIRHEMDGVNKAVDESLSKFAGMEDGLRQHTAALDSTTGEVEERAKAIRLNLHASRQEIESAARLLTREADAAAETLKDQTLSVEGIQDRAAEAIKSLSQSVHQAAARLQDAADAASGTTAATGTMLERQAASLRQLTGAAQAEAREMSDRFQDQQAALSDLLSQARTQSRSLTDTLAVQKETLSDIGETLARQTELIEQALTRSGERAGAVVTHLQERLDTALGALDGRLTSLREGGEATADQIRSAEKAVAAAALAARTALDDQTEAARTGLETQLQTAKAALTAFESDLGALTDAQNQRLEQAVGGQLDKARRTLEGLVTEAGQRLQAQALELESAANQTGTTLDAALDRLTDKIAAADGTASGAAERLRQAAEDFAGQVAAMPREAESGAAQIRAAINREAEALTAAIDRAVSRTHGMTRAVKAVAHAAGPEAQSALNPQEADEIVLVPARVDRDPYGGAFAGAPTGTPDGTGRTAQKPVRNGSERPGPDDATPRRGLFNRRKSAEDEAKPAAQSASLKTTASASPAPDAARPASALSASIGPASKDQSWRDILASAESGAEGHVPAGPAGTATRPSNPRQIVETLQAIAIDLDRALENDPPAELIERYLKRDRDAFARRLTAIASPELSQTARERYRSCADFRNEAESYLSQFESLLAGLDGGSSRNGSETILARTYLTAPTGQVYTLLKEALAPLR